MSKQIEVLGISNDTQWGTILGCRATEWADMDDDEIVAWFEGQRKLYFDDGFVIEFFQVCPYWACFDSGKGHAVLKLAAPPDSRIITPAFARLE